MTTNTPLHVVPDHASDSELLARAAEQIIDRGRPAAAALRAAGERIHDLAEQFDDRTLMAAGLYAASAGDQLVENVCAFEEGRRVGIAQGASQRITAQPAAGRAGLRVIDGGAA